MRDTPLLPRRRHADAISPLLHLIFYVTFAATPRHSFSRHADIAATLRCFIIYADYAALRLRRHDYDCGDSIRYRHAF